MSDPAGPVGEPPVVLQRPPPPRTWRERIDDLADATGVTPARLVLGAIAVLAAIGGAFWALRPPPAPVELSLPYASTSTPGAAPVPADATVPTTATGSIAPEPTEVVVHVAGAVLRPGVHRLRPGARVVQAVRAAGGLAADADGARINLAAPLTDGERVYVPRVGEAEPPEPVAGADPLPPVDPAAAPPAGAPAEPLDLNTADAVALETLPGVGPATAAAILEHRGRVGLFTAVDELVDVPGIGPATLEELRPYVRV